MAYVQHVVSRSHAIDVITARRGVLRSLLRRNHERPEIHEPGSGKLPAIEPIWFPHYLVTVQTHSARGNAEITVSVEAGSGAFAIFQLENEIQEGEPPGELHPPALSEPEATELGRKLLLRTILVQRSRGQKPRLGATKAVRLLQYPYWVYYYARRGALIDIKAVDGVLGTRTGAKTRTAILQAFCDAQQTTLNRK